MGLDGVSGVTSNDILSTIDYPDPTTGQASSPQEDIYLTNAMGQDMWAMDRNRTIHQYTYDVLGRLTTYDVTSLGYGVDGTVQQITYGYDSRATSLSSSA